MVLKPKGGSLLVSDGGGSDIFLGLQNVVLYTFGYVIWSIIGIFFGLLMRKFDKMSARLSFSPNYCRVLA